MTWEEKLIKLLGFEEVTEFNSDRNLTILLKTDKSFSFLKSEIEAVIKTGNVEKTKKLCKELEDVLRSWKQIFQHIKKNMQCVDLERHSNNFKWNCGKFSLGYNFAPNGLEGMMCEKELLKLHRLVRDGEKRCLKHARFKQM